MRKFGLGIFLLLTTLSGCDQQALVRHFVDGKIQAGAEVEAYTLGVKAYTWGLTATEMYRWLDTMVLDTENPRHAPFNAFYHDSELAGPDYRGFDIPNSDTLYSYAWLDLRTGPVVVSTGGSDGRYYSLQFIDFYSELIQYVSLRTHGDGPAEVLVTPPGWAGVMPKGMTHIASPTAFVLVLARVVVAGEADLPLARGIQRQWHIQAQPAPAGAAASAVTSRDNLQRYHVDNAATFYDQLQYVLGLVPPKPKDRPHWFELRRIGLGVPGKAFAQLGLATQQGISRAYADAPRVLEKALVEAGESAGGGWAVSRVLGRYGDDYVQRSTVTAKGFGAHLPLEALYYVAHFDESGAMLDGGNSYQVRIPASLPAQGFWSLALYDRGSDRLVANPIQRYVINDRTANLQRDSDGSVRVTVQREAPVDTANWLPAPEGGFYLALRLYMPQQQVLEGHWQPPPIQRSE